MKESAAQIANNLLQINAIRLNPQNPFRWASGMLSPIYCDNRLLLSYPTIRKQVIDAFVTLARAQGSFDLIAGVATAGIPHGVLLAERLNLPFVYVRGKAKKHGRQNKIEGHLTGNEKVLVIEDLISTGNSCIEAAQALESEGCQIVSILAIFTYGLDAARKNFDEAGFIWDTLTNYELLLQEAVEQEYIRESDLKTLTDWRNDPSKWQMPINQ